MATAKERDQFVAQLTRALPDKPPHIVADAARLLCRHAKTHGNIAEMQCNGHPAMSSPTIDMRIANKLQADHEAWCDKREQQIEKRITAICTELGLVPNFGGDPRGYTVKVHLPNGAYNTWGGAEEGYGVPQ